MLQAVLRRKIENRVTSRYPYLLPLFEHYKKTWVVRQSPYVNIYYCCTQKTASQWLRRLLKDPTVYKYTGLRMVPYSQLGLKYAKIDEPFPLKTIATHLYIDYQTYQSIPKPPSYKAFFVMRDPRDMVVSWYFSAKYSHKLVDPIPQLRRDLLSMNQKDGLKYIIDKLKEFGSYDVQRSWIGTGEKILRYEHLAADHRAFLRDLFNHLEIQASDQEFEALCHEYRFERVAEGRHQGKEDKDSNYRKGIAGDWKNYFDDEITKHFLRVTGDLVTCLGYESS